MDEKVRCPYCSRTNVIKRGLRKLKTGDKQRYLCKDCYHKFSLGLGKKRFDVKIILNAVYYHNQGYGYEEICDIISRKQLHLQSIRKRHIRQFECDRRKRSNIIGYIKTVKKEEKMSLRNIYKPFRFNK